MPTLSQQRRLIQLKIPEALADLLEIEAQETNSSVAAMARQACKWHQGLALGRHPGRPALELPPTESSLIAKGMLLDEEDVTYLDTAGGLVGLARTATLIIIMLEFLGLPALPRVKPEG